MLHPLLHGQAASEPSIICLWHRGQNPWPANQGPKHSVWYTCLHLSGWTSSSSWKGSKQITLRIDQQSSDIRIGVDSYHISISFASNSVEAANVLPCLCHLRYVSVGATDFKRAHRVFGLRPRRSLDSRASMQPRHLLTGLVSGRTGR